MADRKKASGLTDIMGFGVLFASKTMNIEHHIVLFVGLI